MKGIATFLILLLSGSFFGCGFTLGTDPSQPAVQTIKVMDGVKLITPFLGSTDPQSFSQAYYRISSESRLLTRFEGLKSIVDDVDIQSPVRMVVTLDTNRSTSADAVANLKACPITTPWAMYATWTYGHPFGASGRWHTPGGDYETGACVTPTASGTNNQTLTFDISQYFLLYPSGQNKDDGLILISPTDIFIVGDLNATTAPQITYTSD